MISALSRRTDTLLTEGCQEGFGSLIAWRARTRTSRNGETIMSNDSEQKNAVVWFEIPATDFGRAAGFLRDHLRHRAEA